MHVARQKALADAAFYKTERLAQANQLKFTPEYIQAETYKALRDQVLGLLVPRVCNCS